MKKSFDPEFFNFEGDFLSKTLIFQTEKDMALPYELKVTYMSCEVFEDLGETFGSIVVKLSNKWRIEFGYFPEQNYTNIKVAENSDFDSKILVKLKIMECLVSQIHEDITFAVNSAIKVLIGIE